MATYQVGMATGSEGLYCFVCGHSIIGRYYMLSTTRTQSSKIRLIEKIGDLIGDDYMVVISEEDVICRGCATMINSLDRLEKEYTTLKSLILGYLEKKYDLVDGELVSQGQKKIESPSVKKDVKVEQSNTSQTDFQSRKRKYIEENERIAKDVESKDWVQCTKCKFMLDAKQMPCANHSNKKTNAKITNNIAGTEIAQLIEQAKQNGLDDGGVIQALTDNTTPVLNTTINRNEIKETIVNDNTIKTTLNNINNDNAETVEMIAAEIGNSLNLETCAQSEEMQSNEIINGDEQQIHVTEEQGIIEEGHVEQETNDDIQQKDEESAGSIMMGRQITLQTIEQEDGTHALCMVDENGIILQKVEQAEDGTLYVMAESCDDASKQVLSVGDDGSVQMVLWDDIQQTEDTENQLATF